MTDDRLRALEAHMEVQAEILTAIQAELIEADRLSNSVDRLGVGAAELGKALLQVDKQQQDMSRLGRQINEVEKTAEQAKEQVEVKAADLRRGRRRMLTALAVVLLVFAAAFICGYAALSHANYKSCEKRQETTRVFIALLADFRNERNADRIDRGIERLDKTLNRNCDEQYPIHL